MTRQLSLLALTFPLLAAAQNYTAQKMTDQGLDIVRLTDAAHGVEVSSRCQRCSVAVSVV